MVEMMIEVIALSVGAYLAAFAILIAIDVAILLKLRSSFPQRLVQISSMR